MDRKNFQLHSSASQELLKGIIGGIQVNVIVKPDYPTNVLSKELYRKLREQKIELLTGNRMDSKIEHFTFCGEFTAILKMKDHSKIASFYVQEGSEECVFINEQLAKCFGLIKIEKDHFQIIP